MRTLGGWIGSFLFAAFFLAIATPLFLLHVQIIPLPSDAHDFAISAFLPIVGAFFVAAAAGRIVLGIWFLLRENRQANARHSYSTSPSPWLADYPWNQESISGSTRERLLRIVKIECIILISIAAASIVLGMFNPGVVLLFIYICLCIAALPLPWAIYLLTKLKRIGCPKLLFNTFPYFAGDRVSLQLVLTQPNTSFENKGVQAVVRAIEERTGRIEVGRRTTSWTAGCAEIYSQEVRAEISPDHQSLSVAFTLPADIQGSNLADFAGPRYWELDVRARVNGLDFQERFLLPVYRRPENE